MIMGKFFLDIVRHACDGYTSCNISPLFKPLVSLLAPNLGVRFLLFLPQLFEQHALSIDGRGPRVPSSFVGVMLDNRLLSYLLSSFSCPSATL